MKRVIWIVFIFAVLLMSSCRDSGEIELDCEESKILGRSRDYAVRYLEKQGYESVLEVYEYSYLTEAERVTGWWDDWKILFLSKGPPPGDVPLSLEAAHKSVYWKDLGENGGIPAYVSY